MVKFNWKKKIAKALVFAMAIGTVGVHGMSLKSPMVVMAEGEPTKPEPTGPAISIKYEDGFYATIAGNGDEYLFLEVLKDEKGDKGVSATYCIPANGEDVIVDLSFLKITKVSYLRAYGSNDLTLTGEPVTVNAQLPKKAIKYVAGQDSVLKSFTIGGSEPKQADLDAYSVRTQYGSEIDLDYATLQNLRITGTTLIFQEKATDDQKGDGGKITSAGHPAGPEIKVKVAAIPKAPKITVDYLKDAIKLAKGTQYSLVGEKDKDGNEKWIETGDKAISLSPIEIIVNVMGLEDEKEEGGKTKEEQAQEIFDEDGVTLMVRTKGDSSKKKCDSQPALLRLEASTPIEKVGTDKVAVKDYKTGEEPKNYLTYEYTEKGIKLTTAGVAFDYSTDDGETWKTVKANANTTVKGKYEVTVRASGVKPNAKQGIKEAFPSNQVQVKVLPKAAKPDVKELVVTASTGNTLTFSESGTDKYKVTIAGSAKYEWKDNNTWKDVTSESTFNHDSTVTIRVAAVTNTSEASDEVTVKLPKITAD